MSRNRRKKKDRKTSDERALQELTDLVDQEPGQKKSRPVTTSLGDLLRDHMKEDGHND